LGLREVSSYEDLRSAYEGYWYDGLTRNVFIQVNTSSDSTYQVECVIATTGISVQAGAAPPTYLLAQNFPNPFNSATTIRYGLRHKTRVTLAVYNSLGQQVAILVQSDQEAGYQEVKFDGSNLASGLYFYRLQAGDFVQTRKLLLLR
jgi:hypothetical protein